MRPELLRFVYDESGLADLDPAQRRLRLRRLVGDRVAPHEVPRELAALADEIDGFGVLSRFMEESEVTDILVNALDEIWIERNGTLERTNASFEDESVLWALTERLVGDAGVRADASSPITDARLRDGSRLHVVLPPVAPGGPILSIRKFPSVPLDLDELERRGTMTASEADKLRAAVQERATIAIGGATGTGKTTLLNALLSLVDESERVVTIEETSELRPMCAHVVPLVARAANLEGCGELGLDRLLRSALRMRPDRIVVGEVRGPEAVVALAALSTGHRGSMVTVHARSTRGIIERLVSLALEAGSGASEGSLTRRVVEAFDLLVHLHRVGGRRRLAEIVSAADL